MMMRREFIAFVVAIACAWPAEIALGWGREGHAIVADIAEARLNSSARKEIERMLGPGRTMADVSHWADEHKTDITATWHFVNIRVREDGQPDAYDPNADSNNGNCVIEAIKRQKEILAGRKNVGNRPDFEEKQREALYYLIHFCADIHQPLHCAQRRYGELASDCGGNEEIVIYPGEDKPVKLHYVWDESIILLDLLDVHLPNGQTLGENEFRTRTSAYAKSLAADLGKRKEQVEQWQAERRPEAWAMESHRLAVQFAYAGIPLSPPQTPHVIDRRYIENAKPVVREQLFKAGVRLAELLNEVFPQAATNEMKTPR